VGTDAGQPVSADRWKEQLDEQHTETETVMTSFENVVVIQ
jgi:hypothetical protein